MEYLRLVKDNDNWYLPDESWISELPFNVRYKGVSKALAHGTVNTGDGKIDGRSITLTTLVDECCIADYLATMDTLKRRLYRPNQRLYVAEDRYIKLSSLYSFKDDMEKGFKNRRCTVEAVFKCDDPFFYADDIQTQSFTVSTDVTVSGYVFTIENISNVDVPPVITITASDIVDNAILQNNLNGRLSRYADPQLTSGVSVVMDSVNATVERKGAVNTINNFFGTFQHLETGSNEFVYKGKPCVIKVEYLPRWL